MNIQDKNKKLISPLVANQLPQSIKGNYDSSLTSSTGRSIFSDFIQAYYEFIEREVPVELDKFKNTSINKFSKKSVLSLGSQDGGPYNITNRLPALRDFDHTMESLKRYIKFEYLKNVPDIMEGNLNNLFRIMRTINLSKGSEVAYKTLFRFLWNRDVDLTETANEIFKTSANHYKTEKILRVKLIGGSDITTSADIVNFKDNYIVGVDSGAKVLVNSIFTLLSGNSTYYEMSIDEGTLVGSFTNTEEVYAQTQLGANVLITGTTDTIKAKIVPGISNVTLTNTGMGYVSGDVVEIETSTGHGAKIRVKDVDSGPVDVLIKESSGDGYAVSGSEENLSFSSAYIDVYNGETAGVMDTGGSASSVAVETVGYTGAISSNYTNFPTIGAGNDDLRIAFQTDTFGSVAHPGEIKTYTVTPPTSSHWPTMTYVSKTATEAIGTDAPTEDAIFKVDVVSGSVETYTNNAPGTGGGEIDWTDNTFNELPSTTDGDGIGATFKVVISASSTVFTVTTVEKGSGYENSDKIFIAEPNNGTGTTLELTLHGSTGVGATYTVDPSTSMGQGYSATDDLLLSEAGKSNIAITVDSVHTGPSVVNGGSGYVTNNIVYPLFPHSSTTGASFKITGDGSEGIGDWRDGVIFNYVQNNDYSVKASTEKIYDNTFIAGSGYGISRIEQITTQPSTGWGSGPHVGLQPASGSIRTSSITGTASTGVVPNGTFGTEEWTSPRTYTNKTGFTNSGATIADTKGAKFTIVVSNNSNTFTATLTEPGKGYSVDDKLYFKEGNINEGTGTPLEVTISELVPRTARFTVEVSGTTHTATVTTEGSGYKVGDLIVLEKGGADDVTPIKVTGAYVNLVNHVEVENDNEITITDHNFDTGDAVMYKQIETGTGFSIGLVTDTSYYVVKVDDNTIKLSDTYANATATPAVGIKTLNSSILTGGHKLLRHVTGLKNIHATANVIVKAYPLDQLSEASNGLFPNVWRVFIDDITGEFAVNDTVKMGTLVGNIINVHTYQAKPLGRYKLKTDGTAVENKRLDTVSLLDGGAGYKIAPQPYIHWDTTSPEKSYNVASGSFVVGVKYKITAIGNAVNWSAWGGSETASVDDIFTATAVGAVGAGYALSFYANIKAYGSSIGAIKNFDIIDPGLDYVSTDQVVFPNKINSLFSAILLYDGETKGVNNANATAIIKLGALLDKRTAFSDNIGFADTTQKLPDFNTYQQFSYALETTVHPDKFKDVVKALLHPAGMRMIAKYVIESKISQGPTTKVLWDSQA